MKMRVCYSDGIFRGGLFNLEVYTRLNSRIWDGPPHPDNDEHLLDISGAEDEIYEGCFFRVLVSRHPELTGSKECDDLFDHNSRAIRLKAREAACWLRRCDHTVPQDLEALLHEQDESQSPDEITPAARSPLTPRQREVWNLLDHKAKTDEELAQNLYGDRTKSSAARKLIQGMRERGYEISRASRHGYFRLDAPPDELA